MAQGLKAGVITRGNGCRIHKDCFTCPVPSDCVWPLDGSAQHKKRIADMWAEILNKPIVQGASK